MAAYIIVDVEVTDPKVFMEDYAPGVPATLEKYGGRYIVRGGQTEVLEGDWQPHRTVVVEFPSVERAKAWWASEEYKDLKALRQRSSNTTMIVVEGV